MADERRSRLDKFIESRRRIREEFKKERPNPSEAFEESMSAPADKTKTPYVSPQSETFEESVNLPDRARWDSAIEKMKKVREKFRKYPTHEFKPFKMIHGSDRPSGEEQKGGRRQY